MIFTMNRNLLFTSLMLCCSVMAISQQAKLSCFTNNLIVGDSIRYDLVDIEKLCIERMMNRHGISQILSIWERREKCPSMVRILQRLG